MGDRMRSSASLVLLVAGLVLSGCPTAPAMRADAGGRTCTNSAECDDGHACTFDTCGVGGICSYMTVDALCTPPETCRVGVGCTTEMPCDTATDCDDSIACTIDNCAIGNRCTHMAVNALCSGATPFCSVTAGCTTGGDAGPGSCTTSAECDDAIACTIDTCGVAGTCTRTPMDALCGTGMMCNATTGCFMPMPCTVDEDCADGTFCNGRERCMPEFGCVPPTAPPACSDTNPCTINHRCDATTDMCVADCDRGTPSCASDPICAAPPVSCIGSFRITPAPGRACILGDSFNVGTVTFSYDGFVLTVTPASTGMGWTMDDVMAPACPDFVATGTVPGMCNEIYTLRGTFTDDDNFTGFFDQTFEGDCLICGGTDSTPVTGTRI